MMCGMKSELLINLDSPERALERSDMSDYFYSLAMLCFPVDEIKSLGSNYSLDMLEHEENQ